MGAVKAVKDAEDSEKAAKAKVQSEKDIQDSARRKSHKTNQAKRDVKDKWRAAKDKLRSLEREAEALQQRKSREGADLSTLAMDAKAREAAVKRASSTGRAEAQMAQNAADALVKKA